MHGNDLGVSSTHMMDVMMSNTESIRSKYYNNTFATRNKHSANLLSSGVNKEAVTHFAEKDSSSPLFNDIDMYDQGKFKPDLTSLGDPLAFIEKQAGTPFELEKCDDCGETFKYYDMLHAHWKICKSSSIDIKKKERKRCLKKTSIVALSGVHEKREA